MIETMRFAGGSGFVSLSKHAVGFERYFKYAGRVGMYFTFAFIVGALVQGALLR